MTRSSGAMRSILSSFVLQAVVSENDSLCFYAVVFGHRWLVSFTFVRETGFDVQCALSGARRTPHEADIAVSSVTMLTRGGPVEKRAALIPIIQPLNPRAECADHAENPSIRLAM